MKNYVLVIKKGNGLQIGIRRYTKKEAEKRLEELSGVGINNMVAMHIDEAFGVDVKWLR